MDGLAGSKLEKVDDLRGPHGHLSTAALVDGAARIVAAVGHHHNVVQIGQIVPRPVRFTLLLRSHCRDLVVGAFSTHRTKTTMRHTCISVFVGQRRRGRARISRSRHGGSSSRQAGNKIVWGRGLSASVNYGARRHSEGPTIYRHLSRCGTFCAEAAVEKIEYCRKFRRYVGGY